MIILGAVTWALSICARPFILAYSLLLFTFINGLLPRSLIGSLKYTIGSVNVFPLDLCLFSMGLLIIIFPAIKLLKPTVGIPLSRESIASIVLALLYVSFQASQAAVGFFAGVPPDALIRMFSSDAQPLYLLIPLLYGREGKQFTRLLVLTVLLSLVFPFGQLALVGSEDQSFILQGQGTFRLGFGDFNVILSIALLALVIWYRNAWLAALPAVGIVLLAHRSAFIGIMLSYAIVAVVLKRKLSSLFLLVLVGMLLSVILFLFESFTESGLIEHGISRAGETFEDTGTTGARFVAIENSLRVFSAHPLFGMGYVGVMELRQQEQYSAFAFNVLHPHNFLMGSLTKDGLVGTTLLLLLMGLSLLSSLRLARLPGEREAGALLMGSTVFFVVFSLMNTALTSIGYVLWWLAGTSLWMLSHARAQAAETPTAAVQQPSKELERVHSGVRLR